MILLMIPFALYSFQAPELLQLKRLTPACDVYSFGVLLWELVHPERKAGIYPDCPSFAPWAVMQHVIEGGRPVWAEGAGPPPAYRRLATRCWDTDASKRPSFEEIVEILGASVCDESDEYVESW